MDPGRLDPRNQRCERVNAPHAGSETDRAVGASLRDPLGTDSLVIDVDRSAETVTVEITGTAPQLVPGITWTVTARAESPVERFVSAADR